MPKSTGAGVILGALGFLLGFAMIWHIYWLAAICLVAVLAVLVMRCSNDDDEYTITATEVEAFERTRIHSSLTIPSDAEVAGAAAGKQPQPGNI